MPTYEYECPSCGQASERTCRMADYRPTIECACGKDAERVYRTLPDSIMKNTEYRFDMAKNVMTNAGYFGRSDLAQHDNYNAQIQEMKSLKRRFKPKGNKGAQWLGSMPGAMADSIAKHEGDPTVLQKDPVTFLKKTGLYQGDD